MRADLSLAKLRGELVIPSQFTNSFLQRLLSKVLFCGNKNKPNSLNVRTSMMSGSILRLGITNQVKRVPSIFRNYSRLQFLISANC